MISIHNLTVDFGSRLLFDQVSFVINRRDRIALVGKNGAGKSTLLKLIAGLEEPTSGHVSRPKGIRIGYLPQVMQLKDGNTVYEEVEQAFDDIRRIEEEVARLTDEMAGRTDYDSEGYAQLIEHYTNMSETLALMQQGNYHATIEQSLIGLGFERKDFRRPTSDFSGGWRMRIELAKLLLQRLEVLLLDEPTNHLDIESIGWLEQFIASNAGAVILVSHDRAFIDNTTIRTIEIELGHIYDYKTNYSHYVKLREERLQQQLRAYENQQKMIRETEDFIERFRYKATKSVQVQSRIKQLEKVERVEIDERDRSAFHFRFIPAQPSGSYPVTVEGLSKAYGDHVVFSDATYTIARGEKVAFVGKNGAGKSTMVKCIMGELTDYTGKLALGHNVELGYFAQNEAQELRGDLTVYDTIDREAVGDIRLRLNDLLGAFLFGGEASEKKVSVLSGGERARLAIIRLLLQPANFLILDEPTNHLDMRSKDVLKEAIRNFEGTVIVVSHDREFLDGLVTKVYEFADGRVNEHLGGIYDYLQTRRMQTLTELERSRPEESKSSREAVPETESKADYRRQKENAKQLRALERAVTACEEKIEVLEAQLQSIEQQLQDPKNAADTALFEQYAGVKQELESVLEEWESALEALSEVQVSSSEA